MTRPPSRASINYLLKETILFLVVCYLLLFANNWYTLVNFLVVRLNLIMLSVLSIGWLALSLWPGRAVTAPPPLTRPFLLFLAAYLLTALASIDPRRSLDEVWTAGGYVLGFALTAELVARGWPRELFVKAFLIVGALIAALFWVDALTWYLRWLEAAPGRWLPHISYRLPFGGGIAIFFNLLLMPTQARLVAAGARLPRVLLAVLIVAVLGLLFLSASRAGWLGLLLGGGVLALIKVRDEGGMIYLRRLWAITRQQWRLFLVVGMLGLAALAVVGWGAARLVVSHPEKASSLGAARFPLWIPALETFLKLPLVGQGPLTFGSSYLRANSVPPFPFYPHAHNSLLNLLAETGLVGTAAFAALAVAAFLALWRQVNRLEGADRAVAVGALAAMVTFAAEGLFDTPSIEPFNSTTVALLLGAALAGIGMAGEQPSIRRGSRILARWPLALALLLSATGIYRVWRLAPLHLGVQAANSARWAEAAAQFEETIRRDPGSAIAREQLGLAEAALAARGDATALGRAISAFEDAVRLDPDWWLNRANLAALYSSRGDNDAALREMRAAAALAPLSALAQINLGLVAERAGDGTTAEQAYAATLDLRPEWADAYFWRATPLRARVAAVWRAHTPAPLQTPSVAELEAAVAHRGINGLPFAQLAEAYLNLGRTAEAERLLSLAELAPNSGESQLEILWLKAEIAASREEWETALALGEQALEGFRFQSVLGPGTFGTTAYGPHIFRQEVMDADLTPQLLAAPFTDRWVQRLVRLGDWYAGTGNPSQAERLYRETLTFAPDNAEAAARVRP